MAYPKPLPEPSPITRPFWDAARAHRLELQRCADCSRFLFYPRPLCPHCGGTRLEWRRASGRGTLYSYTVARRAPVPMFESDVPYVIAIVELEEGPHLTSNVVGIAPEALRVGMPLEAVFDDVTETVTLVRFQPA
jgi:uncharacterized OB-fold protein